MRTRTRLVIFAVAAAAFAWLLSRLGLARLAHDAAATGWMIVPIVGLCGVVYLLSAAAWRMTMAGEPRRPSFARTWTVMVAGLAMNFMTPVVNAGGEPFRIAAISPWLGVKRATGSVVVHTLLRSLSYVLVWLTALLLGLWLLPHRAAVMIPLAAAAILAAGLALVLLLGHRHGILVRCYDVAARLPLPRRAGAFAAALRPRLEELDRQIVEFTRLHPGHFSRALALDYLSRSLFMAEFSLIAASTGAHMSYWQAYVAGGLGSLLLNLTFFVPYELGTREGSTWMIYSLLGLDPALGIYTAVVGRVRDLAWIGIGVLLIGPAGRAERAAGAAVTALPEESA